MALGYERPDKWDANVSLFFMIHGTHDKYTVWTRVNKNTNKTTPTTEHQTANYNDENANKRNAPSYTGILSVSSSYSIIKSLSISGEVDLIYIQNPGNIKSASPIFDTQTTINITYTWK